MGITNEDKESDPTDKKEWARMRNLLWPQLDSAYQNEIEIYFQKHKKYMVEVFVLDRNYGKLGGFIELSLRNYAEGSQCSEVPYIEGWYVDRDLRGNGYGKRLLEAAEQWVVGNGFIELV